MIDDTVYTFVKEMSVTFNIPMEELLAILQKHRPIDK